MCHTESVRHKVSSFVSKIDIKPYLHHMLDDVKHTISDRWRLIKVITKACVWLEQGLVDCCQTERMILFGMYRDAPSPGAGLGAGAGPAQRLGGTTGRTQHQTRASDQHRSRRAPHRAHEPPQNTRFYISNSTVFYQVRVVPNLEQEKWAEFFSVPTLWMFLI